MSNYEKGEDTEESQYVIIFELEVVTWAQIKEKCQAFFIKRSWSSDILL